jgi:membrane-associated phospholipid phosphatase
LLSTAAEAQWADVGQDARSLLTPGNLMLLAGGLGLARMSHAWDHRVNGSLDENPVLETIDFTNLVNRSSFNLPAAFMVYAYGRASGNDELRTVSSDVLRALVAVQIVVGPIKHTVGRQRPDGSNDLSFPSGHTANAVAVAEVLRGRYGWKVGAPMYALGALTGIGRMEENVHHLSDVVAGAAFGYVIGRTINRRSESRLNVTPTGKGLAVAIRF